MMLLGRRCPGVEVLSRLTYKQQEASCQAFSLQQYTKRNNFSCKISNTCSRTRASDTLDRPQYAATAKWKLPMEMLLSPAVPGTVHRALCSGAPAPDTIEIHKQRLALWFSHLPQEEKQFGGDFTPDTMHVEPLILEKKPTDSRTMRREHVSGDPPLDVAQLFDCVSANGGERGLNVVLYGAVGTGKSTVVRKLVLDWCAGAALSHFQLLVPFSCEDLCQSTKHASLRDLVGRKYLHLRRTPFLSGEPQLAQNVLFIFNGMERMRMNFSIASTELCSDPNEPLPTATILVNLLRKYLLPEASILVTTRLSAVERIPKKYVSRYLQICGFNDPERQRSYFASRLLQEDEKKLNPEAESLVELLFLNLKRENQLASACFLPSYCWLTCATLHLLRFTDARAPIRTLTGIFTSFLRLNFGGEVLEAPSGSISEQQSPLMRYVVQTVGKLAFDGVTNRRTRFTEDELEQLVGGKTKTDEELRQLAVFRTDVLDFFLVPCVENVRLLEAGEAAQQRYVFATPAMQEYLAALYVVLGENKSALEKLSREVSTAVGQAGEDLVSLVNILSKFIPLRIFAVFNLVRLAPNLFERMLNLTKGRIARTVTAEMFRTEDSFNADVLDQVEQSLLGVQGPQPQQELDMKAFELYPIFMGGLLHYGNRVVLEQLGCDITSTAVAQITRALSRHLSRESRKQQPPAELMDVLLFLYEFQNPHLTRKVLGPLKTINLSTVKMTPFKCVVLSWVIGCFSPGHRLNELNLSSCHLSQQLLEILRPAFLHTRSLNLQCNNLGPDSCIALRDVLLHPNCVIASLQLCDNRLLESGLKHLTEALRQNRSLKRLELMHTELGDQGAAHLEEYLHTHTNTGALEELNVAYNSIGDNAALRLVEACREHHSVHTVHLYLNQLSETGKQSLYAHSVTAGSSRRVKVLTSVTEGVDLSEDWHPILSIIRQNATSWDRTRLSEQLRVFLADLESGRRQQRSLLKKLHFRRVEKGVKECLRMLEHSTP